jgi:hypothetical protein
MDVFLYEGFTAIANDGVEQAALSRIEGGGALGLELGGNGYDTDAGYNDMEDVAVRDKDKRDTTHGRKDFSEAQTQHGDHAISGKKR